VWQSWSPWTRWWLPRGAAVYCTGSIHTCGRKMQRHLFATFFAMEYICIMHKLRVTV
jgi:hypothetical protein